MRLGRNPESLGLAGIPRVYSLRGRALLFQLQSEKVEFLATNFLKNTLTFNLNKRKLIFKYYLTNKYNQFVTEYSVNKKTLTENID